LTVADAIKKLQAAYAEYHPEQRNAVAAWLSRLNEHQIGIVYAEVLRNYSWRWGKPPGPAELEEAWASAYQHREDELFEPPEQRRQIVDESDDVVDPDTAAEFMRDLINGMRHGKHPYDVLADYE
jgi:hypothetical protein